MIPGVVSSAGGLKAPTPTFSAITATDTGFVFTITNYNSNFSYSVSTTAGTVVRDGATVTQGGVSYSTSTTVTVTVSRPGWASKTATKTGTSNAAPPTPPPCTPAGCTPDCGTPHPGDVAPCTGTIVFTGGPGCWNGSRQYGTITTTYDVSYCYDNCGVQYSRQCIATTVDSPSATCCP